MKYALPLAVVAAFALSGCKQEISTPEAGASSAASAANDMVRGKAGITASDGKLVLPAVKGRPGAAYFILSNSNTKAAIFASVAIEGAKTAELHESKGGTMAPLDTFEVRPGEMFMFERGGRHVMAFDLAPTIKPGDTVEMTLTFADGSKVVLPLIAEAAGGGEDHGAMH